MKVLSFDIGVRNLSYCASCDGKIDRWELCDFGGQKDFSETSKALIALLHDSFPDPEWDAVLIENQPVMKNPVMKSIQMIVYSYFSIQSYQHGSGCDVRLVSASNKLKVKHSKDLKFDEVCSSSKYKTNKIKAIAYARSYLELQEERWRTTFDNHKKKDDLADSFLMTIHYFENKV